MSTSCPRPSTGCSVEKKPLSRPNFSDPPCIPPTVATANPGFFVSFQDHSVHMQDYVCVGVSPAFLIQVVAYYKSPSWRISNLFFLFTAAGTLYGIVRFLYQHSVDGRRSNSQGSPFTFSCLALSSCLTFPLVHQFHFLSDAENGIQLQYLAQTLTFYVLPDRFRQVQIKLDLPNKALFFTPQTITSL